jgi:hypothetical protein
VHWAFSGSKILELWVRVRVDSPWQEVDASVLQKVILEKNQTVEEFWKWEETRPPF